MRGLTLLLALALASPANAGKLLLSNAPASVSPIYQGPGYVQSGANNSGSRPFVSVTLGAAPTVPHVLWAIGYSHHGPGTCLSVNTGAGWVNYDGFSAGRATAWAYRVVLPGDSAVQTPFLDNGTCSGAESNATEIWEWGGLSTANPASNVAFETLQDGGGGGITPNYSFNIVVPNNAAMFSNADLNTPVSALSGSPWTHLITSGSVVNGGDYTLIVPGGIFTGTTTGTSQFQAGMLVLH